MSVNCTCIEIFVTGLEINFEELDYSTEEGGTLSNNIRLQFRNNQNTFTLTLCPMNVDTVDYFMDNFEEISKATAGIL